MKCIFTGGGTLGHTNPAIAVAEKIRERCNDAEIIFIMRKRGAENSAVLKRGFDVKEICVEGFIRNGKMRDGIRTSTLAIRAIHECIGIIKETNPSFIFGTGGYVSFAPMIAGLIKGIPTFVHESNSMPGLVTKMGAKLGAIPLVSTEAAKKRLKGKKDCNVVGTPLLPYFGAINKEDARRRLRIDENIFFIVSFGGSGGSKMLNDIITELMNDRCRSKTNILQIHATGEKYFKKAEAKYPRLTSRVSEQRIVSRIEDMPLYMSAADLIICRCGASTIAELIAVGRPAILIPSPNVTDNHQYENGLSLANLNAAIMLEEKDLTKETLTRKISLLMQSKQLRKDLEKNLAKLRKTDSADIIADILLNSL